MNGIRMQVSADDTLIDLVERLRGDRGSFIASPTNRARIDARPCNPCARFPRDVVGRSRPSDEGVRTATPRSAA